MGQSDGTVRMLKSRVRHIPNFPKEGVDFIDIIPLLADRDCFQEVIFLLRDEILSEFKGKIDKIVAIEARGFLIAPALAYLMGYGLVIVRKKGKLPFKTVEIEYELEYGKATSAMHIDAVKPGERVLIVDDLLATGGTARAAAELVEKLGGKVVGFAFLVEISSLGGRGKLKHPNISSLLVF